MFNCNPSEGVTFIFGGAREDTDWETKQPKRTKDGQPIWRVQLVGFQPERPMAELAVKVTGAEPKVSPGTPVQLVGLVAAPYKDRQSGRTAYSFTAQAVKAA